MAVISSPPTHRTTVFGRQTHRLIQCAFPPPRHHVDTDRAHVAVHGRPLQRPHPRNEWVLFILERGSLEYIDGHDDVTAFAQIDQGQRELGIEQRRKSNHYRTRRNGSRRRQCPCGGFESTANAEHGIQHPIELSSSDVGAEPPGAAAPEYDDPGAITVSQRALHHLGGTARRSLGRRAWPDPGPARSCRAAPPRQPRGRSIAP